MAEIKVRALCKYVQQYDAPGYNRKVNVRREVLRTIQELESNIFFSDAFSEDPSINENMRNKYSEKIGEIISESLFLFADHYYRAKIELVEYDMMNIKYCIDLYPTVNASVDIHHNWIVLHLFTMIAANSMTIISGLLDLLSFPEKFTNAEIVPKALEWANSYDNMGMIERYIRECSAEKEMHHVSEGKKLYVVWNTDIFQKYKHSGYTYGILKLMFLHELGHWQYERFADGMKNAYYKQAYDVLCQFYSIEYIYSHQQVFDAWIKEIIADYIALLVYTKNSRQQNDGKQCTKECYIAIGLYYGLIAMEELGSGLYKKMCYTHPAVKIRQEAVQKLYANFFSDILGIPYDVFIEDEIQEWHVIQLYFSMIIDEYWRKTNG